MSAREYLRRRAAQEDELASTATNATAAVMHSAMATEYRRRLQSINGTTASVRASHVMSSEAKRLIDRAIDCLSLAKSVRTEADASILEDLPSELKALATKVARLDEQGWWPPNGAGAKARTRHPR